MLIIKRFAHYILKLVVAGMTQATTLSILLFCAVLFFGKIASATQIVDTAVSKSNNQFNFDDNYQGEEAVNYKDDNKVYDPFESFNRKIFIFNDVLDRIIILPVSKGYRKIIPKPIRTSINNFLNNLSTPFSVINSAIQGDGQNAMASFSSFLINSTVGVVGIFDIAKSKNILYEKEDFGQSLGKYGATPGPYLIIPIIGPSNVRDFSGIAITQFIDPLSMNGLELGDNDLLNSEQSISIAIINGINTREGLIDIIDDVRKNSFDQYVTIRSAYSQRRNALIKINNL